MNEEPALEREAERMGDRATKIRSMSPPTALRPLSVAGDVRQLMKDGAKGTLTTLAALNTKLKSSAKKTISAADFEEKIDWTPSQAELDSAVAASGMEYTRS